ncbi:hypothetical protein DOU54_04650 [Agrobacterium sp. MS2]|nr:hypothetical protein DOU54_04650 [Agrobacterium sp. MS2]
MAKHLSIQFHFDDETKSRLVALTAPFEGWSDQYDDLIQAMGGESAAIISAFEGCANRFLRGNLKPNNKVRQKAILQQIEHHSRSLVDLLVSPEIEGTIADPFSMLAKVSKGREKPLSRGDFWEKYYQMLTTLELFAKHRLLSGVEPDQDEEAFEKLKRRKEYPRFVLMADLLYAHKRITGVNPSAYATVDKSGHQKRSEAVEFLSIAVPPILKQAKVKNPFVDDQVLKLEIGRIKKFWDAGRNPALEYTYADWGSLVPTLE